MDGCPGARSNPHARSCETLLEQIDGAGDALGPAVGDGQLTQAWPEVAQARGCTPAQLALAWLLDRNPHIVPIPGTRRIARLEENAAATSISLTESEKQQIAHVLGTQTVAGTRYPEAHMVNLNA